MKETKFKVGDRVFDIRYGWGRVYEIAEDIRESHPLKAIFDNGAKRKSYTLDGRNYFKDPEEAKILSFTEYTLEGFSDERPIDYNEYIGKWGKFWNGENNKDNCSIAKLIEYTPDADFGEQFTCVMGLNHDYFEPLAEEQIKILGLYEKV